MAAYAEGLNILRAANVGKKQAARSTPRRRRCATPSTTSTTSISPTSRRSGGAAASSRRGCSTSRPSALRRDPELAKFAGRVSDSGEGRWTIKAAIDEGVPTPVLTTALYERFSSRGEAEFQDKLLSAMRYEFGGHHEKPAEVGNGGQMSDSPFRRPGLLRRDRRSRLQEDLPVAAGDGEARPPRRAGHRRGQGGLEPRPAQGAGAREHREARRRLDPAAFEKLSGLLRYVDGDYDDAATFRGDPQGARRGATGRHTTWPSRPCSSALVVEQLAESGCTQGARVIVEKPFGRDLASAQALNEILLGTFDERRDLPHRPLPREAAGAQHGLLPLRERVPRAVLEPQPRRERADHHGGGLRRAGPGRRSTTQVGTIRDVVQNHLFQVLANLAMEPPARTRQRVHARREGKGAEGDPAAEPADLVRGPVPRVPRRAGRRAGLEGGDVRRAAARDRFVALAGRAVLHPRRQVAAGHVHGGPGALAAARRTIFPTCPAAPNYLRFRISPEMHLASV